MHSLISFNKKSSNFEFVKIKKKSVDNLQNFENQSREKNANLVDLEKCYKMRLCSLS